MFDRLTDFLDSRGVTVKDFISVVLAMGFLTAMVGVLLYGAIGALLLP
jgi:hypothetical protein